MKNIYIAVALVVLLFAGFYTYSNKRQVANETPSITGLWTDSNSTSFTNCYAIFSEKNGKVTFAHYLEFNGVGMVEEGKGAITGSKIQYDVTVTKPIPGWATSCTHILVLSPDGKTLRGIYKDAKGNTGPLVFKRVK